MLLNHVQKILDATMPNIYDLQKIINQLFKSIILYIKKNFYFTTDFLTFFL